MSSLRLSEIHAHEILDSRGRPTLAVTVTGGDGLRATAEVPAGASTGRREPRELRDDDPARFGGAGVLGAVSAVNGELRELLIGRGWNDQRQLDEALVTADGTADLHRLGSNAIVGVSLAVGRLISLALGCPLWMTLQRDEVPARLPVPHFNVLNGGAHARTKLDFQEFMIAPIGAPSFAEAVRAGAEIYAALRGLLLDGGHVTGLGDEGGFAPEIGQPEDVIRLLQRAIEDAGYAEGVDGVAIALDPAASQFQRDDGSYLIGGQRH
ncbi:MAG: phosphopyruvate hydratase, partial [Sciscionella sp.]